MPAWRRRNGRNRAKSSTVLVRQFGELLLQPMIEAVWERTASKGEKQPRLVIRVDD